MLAVMCLFCSGFGATTARAQVPQTYQQWTALLSTATPSASTPGVALWLDVHARRGAGSTVGLFRPGVGVTLAPWVSLWAGYAWIPTFVDGPGDTVHEHRIWQQLVLRHRIAAWGISLQSRTRLEQRFSTAGDETGWRMRHFARVGWRPHPEHPLGLVLWDEVFVGLGTTDWGAPSGLDQNRLFLGPFLQMAPSARLEGGYLFVHLEREGARQAHVLAVNLFLSLRPDPPPPAVR